ncbi:MAG: sigma-70 family RNA polymerase sigma factor [Thermaerobacter sp.]|nr:sigma-70 family RNA polymerase sigma factor [Thermaerobacter sp.]
MVQDLANLSDRELVSRAQREDASAFGVLAERYQLQLLRLCTALTSDPEAAQELAQTTWARAFEAIGHLREGERFFGWLRQIAVNQLRDGFKRRRLPQVSFDEALHDGPDEALGPEGSLLRQERQAEISQALGMLSEHDRRMLALRYAQDCSYREIALEMGTTEGTVATWLYRAKERLRKALEQGKGRQV